MRRVWMLAGAAVAAALLLVTLRVLTAGSIVAFFVALADVYSGAHDTEPAERPSKNTIDYAQIPDDMKVFFASTDGRTQYIMDPRGDEIVVPIGVCDSVDISALGLGAKLELTFTSPSGRPVTPTTTSSSDIEVLARLTQPEPGEWAVKIANPAPEDGPTAMELWLGAWTGDLVELPDSIPQLDIPAGFLFLTEYGGTDVDVAFLPSKHPRPGSPFTIRITPRRQGKAITEARVAATYSKSGHPHQQGELRLVDDGTSGDLLAGDGTFTATATIDVEGRYDLEIWVYETNPGGSILTRYARVDLWIASYSDLVIEPGGVRLRPTDSTSLYMVDVTFRNDGSGRADSVHVSFEDNQTGLTFERHALANMDPGQERTLSASWRPHEAIKGLRDRGVNVHVMAFGSRLERNPKNNWGSAKLDQ